MAAPDVYKDEIARVLLRLLPTVPLSGDLDPLPRDVFDRVVDVLSCAAVWGLRRLDTCDWEAVCDQLWADLVIFNAAAPLPALEELLSRIDEWRTTAAPDLAAQLTSTTTLPDAVRNELVRADSVGEAAARRPVELPDDRWLPDTLQRHDAEQLRAARLLGPPRVLRKHLTDEAEQLYAATRESSVRLGILWGLLRLKHERWQATRERLWAPVVMPPAVQDTLPRADVDNAMGYYAHFTLVVFGDEIRSALGREQQVAADSSAAAVAVSGGARMASAAMSLFRPVVSIEIATASARTLSIPFETGGGEQAAGTKAMVAVRLSSRDDFYCPAAAPASSGVAAGAAPAHSDVLSQIAREYAAGVLDSKPGRAALARFRALQLRKQRAAEATAARASLAATPPAAAAATAAAGAAAASAPDRGIDELLAEIEGGTPSAGGAPPRAGGRKKRSGGDGSGGGVTTAAVGLGSSTSTGDGGSVETHDGAGGDAAAGGGTDADTRAAEAARLRAARRRAQAAVATLAAEQQRAAVAASAVAASALAVQQRQQLRRDAANLRRRVAAARAALLASAPVAGGGSTPRAASATSTATAAATMRAAAAAARAAAERAAAALREQAAAAADDAAHTADACAADVAAVTAQVTAFAHAARARTSAAVDDRGAALAAVEEAARVWRAAVSGGGGAGEGSLLDDVAARAMVQARAEAAAEAAALRLRLRKRAQAASPPAASPPSRSPR